MLVLDPGRKADLAKIERELKNPALSRAKRVQLETIRYQLIRQSRSPTLKAARLKMTKAIKSRDGEGAERIGRRIVKQHGE